ncbi:MAG TPA: M20 family metallopeptidase [Candidatus Limnocylindrales bacterium]|nr:M20 family metallopeptidase [Candidatus Limnocylindrales bacterium]
MPGVIGGSPTGVRPAEPFADVKARIARAIEEHRAEILDLARRIHANPEPAFEERRAARWVAEAIARHGYRVEHPAGRLETAVRGRLLGGRGSDGPRVAILAEYDALPGLGHGCGHNLMAAQGVGSAIGLAAVRDAFAGEVVFLGCPAEERGSGKQVMLDDGLFEGIDAALLFHPSDRTHTEVRLLASVDIDVTFRGRPAHAAAEPWAGRNALDALVLLLTSIGLWRQQLPPDARVHGIVLEGGTAANIIPERAVGRFMVRSLDEATFAELQDRFRRQVEAAALATDTLGEAVFSGASSTMRHNRTLGRRFAANMAVYGLDDGPPDEHLGSSDVGNVSQALPTIHPHIAICEPGTPGHSEAFRDAAASERGEEAALVAATVVAQTAFELLADRGLVEAAWAEFRAAGGAGDEGSGRG